MPLDTVGEEAGQSDRASSHLFALPLQEGLGALLYDVLLRRLQSIRSGGGKRKPVQGLCGTGLFLNVYRGHDRRTDNVVVWDDQGLQVASP